jgi:L-ascorbate metabolism protein UlaG (beta-lactamase superfamily)
MELIRAFQKNEAFLADVKKNQQDKSTVGVWWLGQSGYLIHYNNTNVLIDPYLSDSLTKKYADTKKPHVRMSEQVVRPENLDFIDIVTSSHNHTDHLDGETLIPLLNANAEMKMIIPEANRRFVTERINMPLGYPLGMNDGERLDLGDVVFHGIPAAHNELERDELGQCKYMGYVIEIGGKKIYHSGDTLLFEGMADLLAPYQIDLALLPINGNDPARGVAGNLSIDEAIQLGLSIGANLTIPCHYDMFTFNTADPGEFAEKARSAALPFKVLMGGEGLMLSK